MTIYKITPSIVQRHYYIKANSAEEEVDAVNMLNEQSAVGDLVQCSWCEKVMIVNIGEDVCPACNTEGTLSWIEGCPKEVEL